MITKQFQKIIQTETIYLVLPIFTSDEDGDSAVIITDIADSFDDVPAFQVPLEGNHGSCATISTTYTGNKKVEAESLAKQWGIRLQTVLQTLKLYDIKGVKTMDSSSTKDI